jgi:bifunctional DNA-binding transcriptional regulator/antitoxin component of YhaV-PrlF toxin-antitoxin module
MPRVRVTKKYQVTVPKKITDEVAWDIGTERFATVSNGLLYLDTDPAAGQVVHSVELRNRNQITIPAAITRALAIEESALLDMHTEGIRIVVEPKIVFEAGIKRQLAISSENAKVPQSKFEPSYGLKELAARGKRALRKQDH